MAKCLIAGLPSAGKSTYIGALAYLLQNPVKGQCMVNKENPEDMSYLNRLSEPWLNQQLVDRTVRGVVNGFDLKLKRNETGEEVALSIPDIAGEDFISVIQKQKDVVTAWSETTDSLLFFINKWETNVLAEELGDTEPMDISKEPPAFSVDQMSAEVQNVLLLKELLNIFPCKKIAIGLSSWDEYMSNYNTPWEMIEQRARFLFNFLKHYYPTVYVFGISAQGAKYSDDEHQAEELMQKTLNGERAFVVTPCGEKVFDLTLPLIYLMEN